MRVLAVYAHPDDEVLAAGASLARYAREGHEVHIAILGEGITSRSTDRATALDSGAAKQELSELQGHAAVAAKCLGAKSCRTFTLPDNRFDSIALLDVIKVVEGLRQAIDPDIVFTHHVGDMNVDHGVLANAVMTAFRSLPEEKARFLLAGEVLSSTDYSIGLKGCGFEPNWWIPVAEADVAAKQQALATYVGELRPFPHPRSVEAVAHLAAVRGVQCGHPNAEAFCLLRAWGHLPGAAEAPAPQRVSKAGGK